jgi:hypothetical protein
MRMLFVYLEKYIIAYAWLMFGMRLKSSRWSYAPSISMPPASTVLYVLNAWYKTTS